MKKIKKKGTIKRIALSIAGSISLLLGAIGIILPILPTTPFVLLSAACFSLSSPRMAKRLEESRIFGSYLRHWRTHEGVPRKTKIRAIIWLWLGLGISAALVRTPLVIIVLGTIGTIVTIHLILIKTQKEKPEGILAPTEIGS